MVVRWVPLIQTKNAQEWDKAQTETLLAETIFCTHQNKEEILDGLGVRAHAHIGSGLTSWVFESRSRQPLLHVSPLLSLSHFPVSLSTNNYQ